MGSGIGKNRRLQSTLKNARISRFTAERLDLLWAGAIFESHQLFPVGKDFYKGRQKGSVTLLGDEWYSNSSRAARWSFVWDDVSGEAYVRNETSPGEPIVLLGRAKNRSVLDNAIIGWEKEYKQLRGLEWLATRNWETISLPDDQLVAKMRIPEPKTTVF
jgi:hypothetical protein